MAELQNEVEIYSLIHFDEGSNKFLNKKPMPDVSHRKNKRKSTSSATTGSSKSNKLFSASKSSQTTDSMESLEIDTLISYLEEYRSMLNDKIVNLNKDIKLKQKEWEDDVRRLQEQNLILIERQQLMEERHSKCIQQSVKFGKDLVIREMIWTKEQSKIISSLESLYLDLTNNSVTPLKISNNAFLSTNSLVMQQVTQRDHLMNWYHSQLTFMEEQIKQQASELTKLQLSHKDKCHQLTSQLEYFKGKLKQEAQRRRFDMEGFLSSINLLNDKVKHLERKFKKRRHENRNILIESI